jgi:cell wall assembly regulator SMI1
LSLSTAALNGSGYPGSPLSHHPSQSPGPNSPYSPGMRSSAVLQRQSTNDTFETASPGEIQLQAFQEGLPPPPPVGHSWKRIDGWAEENYEELFDQLGEGCTNNDLNELEHQLDCSLPMEVRESLQIHDGQERGGIPTGIIFGSMLLDCEEIVQEWQNWKKVGEQYLSRPVEDKPATPAKTLGGSSSASTSKPLPGPPTQNPNPNWRQDLLAKQDSQPPGAIQKVYAHPAWIPLARDWGGNNLAVDLAPGPTGKWGQIILFGRDYDCKYVVARSWSAFLAVVADDLNSAKWFVDEETNELKLREFKTKNVEPGYLDILRWRADQKYGRKVRRKTPPVSAAGGSPGVSPYASPSAEMGEPRGRSMQRFSGASPVASPHRPGYPKSSPLARVTEESAKPVKVRTSGIPDAKLVEVDSPKTLESAKQDKALEPLLEPATTDGPVETKEKTETKAVPAETVTLIDDGDGVSSKKATIEDEDTLKTIEI